MKREIEKLIAIYKAMLPVLESMESDAFMYKKDTLKMVIEDLEKALEVAHEKQRI